jgi:hypothetical protein
MPRIIQTFTDFGNRKWKDRLSGGKADDKHPEDFPDDELAIGFNVEREHTSNPDEATEIAMDHISEDPEYYDKLITAGIADEEGAVDLFKELKGKNAREKAKQDIIDFMEEEDDYYNDDIEDFNEEDFEEDDLGTDLSDIEDDDENELVTDEDEPKNKKKVMENTIRNYKSFLKINESDDVVAGAAPTEEGSPERKISKENKYKFQLPYDEKVVNKLNDYNFVSTIPDDQRGNVVKPTPATHFIIIDIMGPSYSIVDHQTEGIRMIDSSRLKNILENL